MFFDSWADIGRVLIVGTLAYIALIVFLRISGKRTLAKMNAFDLIVTVSLGSTLATILLSKDTALADGVTALFTLIALQYLIAWLSVRSETFASLIKSEPKMLFFEGRFLRDVMRSERVTEEEVLAAIRIHGFPRAEDVGAVILETHGTFSVLPAADGKATVLRTLSNEAMRH